VDCLKFLIDEEEDARGDEVVDVVEDGDVVEVADFDLVRGRRP